MNTPFTFHPITLAFFDGLAEIIDDNIYIGMTSDDLLKEIQNNTWSISASQEEVEHLRKEDLSIFFDKVIQNRLKQIKNAPEKHGMIFYMWFDEQASQIRFSLISDFHKSLPFRNPHLIFLRTPEAIYEQFIDSKYHDGIPFSELEIKDWDGKENKVDKIDESENTIKIYRVLLKH